MLNVKKIEAFSSKYLNFLIFQQFGHYAGQFSIPFILSCCGGKSTMRKTWMVKHHFVFSLYHIFLMITQLFTAPMFFGFVGLFNAALLWPGLIFCHFTGNETFEMPTIKQWEFLIINGFIGTVLSELLWLLGCFCKNSSILLSK